MNLQSKCMRNSQTAYRNLEGEGLIMNPSDSTLHSLNEVAGAVWEFIEAEHSVEEVVEMVLSRFNIDRETATADVTVFLEALEERQLAKVIDPGAGGPCPSEA